jgi:hypothetical protein
LRWRACGWPLYLFALAKEQINIYARGHTLLVFITAATYRWYAYKQPKTRIKRMVKQLQTILAATISHGSVGLYCSWRAWAVPSLLFCCWFFLSLFLFLLVLFLFFFDFRSMIFEKWLINFAKNVQDFSKNGS